MCFAKKSTTPATAAIVASANGPEALREANMQDMIRRRRSGAAANILTSQMGIPFAAGTSRTGEVGAA